MTKLAIATTAGLLISLVTADAQYLTAPRAPTFDNPFGQGSGSFGNDRNSPRNYGRDGSFDPNGTPKPFGRFDGNPYLPNNSDNPFGPRNYR